MKSTNLEYFYIMHPLFKCIARMIVDNVVGVELQKLFQIFNFLRVIELFLSFEIQ